MSDSLGFLERQRLEVPSELMLDRYVANELAAEQRRLVEAWCAASPEHQARLDARRSFPEPGAADRLFANLQARQGRAADQARAPSESRLAAWWRRLIGPGVLTVVAFALVLLVVRPWQVDPDAIRAKGGFGFLVHRKTTTGSEVFVSGGEARAGDVLRFEVDLPEAGFLIVLDQDPSGLLTTAWPLAPADTAAGAGTPMRRVAPGARALEGAVELDDALGDEWLHAVVCTDSQQSAGFAIAGPGRLRLPPGCDAQAIHLLKAR